MPVIECGARQFEAIEAIIFDKDGTLCDSAEYLRNLAQRRARRLDARVPGVGDPLLLAFGVERNVLNPDGLLNVGTRQENEIAAAAYLAETGLGWLEAVRLAVEGFKEAEEQFSRLQYAPIFSDTIPTLEKLHRAGLKLAILSSDTTNNVEQFSAHYRLGEWVQVTQGADGLAQVKPDPTVFWQLCKRLGVSPQATLIVGDSPVDIALARRGAAAGAIAVARGASPVEALAEADCVLETLAGIAIQPV